MRFARRRLSAEDGYDTDGGRVRVLALMSSARLRPAAGAGAGIGRGADLGGVVTGGGGGRSGMVSSASSPGQPVLGVAKSGTVASKPSGAKLGRLDAAGGRRSAAGRGSIRPKPLAVEPDPARVAEAPGPAAFGALAVVDAPAGVVEGGALRGVGVVGDGASFLTLGVRVTSGRVGFSALAPDARAVLRQATQCVTSPAFVVSHSAQVHTDAAAVRGGRSVLAMVSALGDAADADFVP